MPRFGRRWRGGAAGAFGRGMSRRIMWAYYPKNGKFNTDGAGSCFLILLFIILSPLLIYLLPLLPFVAIIGLGVFLVKKRYIQSTLSWFFRKESESNETMLPYKEILNRIIETIKQSSMSEKVILSTLVIFLAVICELFFITLMFNSSL